MQSKLKKQTTQKDSEALLQFGIRNGKKNDGREKWKNKQDQ